MNYSLWIWQMLVLLCLQVFKGAEPVGPAAGVCTWQEYP